jgi:hypothetical protein
MVDRAQRRLLGENVLVDYCLDNTSGAAFPIRFGGDYRGSSRHTRFKITATDASGRLMPDPDPNPFGMGGLSMDDHLDAGQSHCESVPLMRYVRVDAPGEYLVRVGHDLGWTDDTPPAGEIKVTFVMPTPAEAEQVVVTMASQRFETPSYGHLTPPYPDFTALRYPVYLPLLEKRAQAGDERAVHGISEIPSLDATRVLLKLLEHP